jgi:hypothetical protein
MMDSSDSVFGAGLLMVCSAFLFLKMGFPGHATGALIVAGIMLLSATFTSLWR